MMTLPLKMVQKDNAKTGFCIMSQGIQTCSVLFSYPLRYINIYQYINIDSTLKKCSHVHTWRPHRRISATYQPFGKQEDTSFLTNLNNLGPSSFSLCTFFLATSPHPRKDSLKAIPSVCCIGQGSHGKSRGLLTRSCRYVLQALKLKSSPLILCCRTFPFLKIEAEQGPFWILLRHEKCSRVMPAVMIVLKISSHRAHLTKFLLPSENPFPWGNREIYLLSDRHATYFKCQPHNPQTTSVR